MSPETLAQHRVLIVDDEEIVLLALREMLRRSGHTVVVASTPQQALEELKAGEFAVLMTDHNMPVMTGLQLIAQARTLQPDITCILITAVLNLDTVINAINHGEIYRFIVKPWLREELLGAVRSGIARYDLILRQRKLMKEMQGANERLARRNRELEEQIEHLTQQQAEITRLAMAAALPSTLRVLP
jgi:DNA-binding NtrC family response regulator